MWRVLPLITFVCLSAKTKGLDTPKDPPPQITFLSKDRVKPGEVKGSFDLQCNATGKNLKWTWKFNGGRLPNRVKSKGNMLVGEFLGMAESGRYQCFVEDTVNNVKTFSREIEIKVTVVGNFYDNYDMREDVRLGQPLVMDCPDHSPNYGVTYSWEGMKNKVQLERNERRAISPTGRLVITSITQEDINFIETQRGIRCKISAINTYFESVVLTLNKVNTQATSGPPRWVAKPGAKEQVIEGRQKELYCVALGNPAPKITWKKNGVKLEPSSEDFEIPNIFYSRLLNVTKAKKNVHHDNYSCEAEVNGRTVLTHRFELQVQVIPKWKTGPPKSKVDVRIHGSETLTCDAVADPAPTYSWYRDGNKITTSTLNDGKIKVENNKLHFKGITLEEDGIYQCVARNDIGMIVSSTWVHVLTQAPSFERNGFGPFYLFEGSKGRLECVPEAAPRPTEFRWSKDGGPELSGGRYTVEKNGTLVIDKINSTDAGEYKCSVKNLLGSAAATANATIYAGTSIVIAPKSRKVDKATRLDLRCEAEADPRLTVKYNWTKDGSPLEYQGNIEWRESQNVLIIADITVFDSGIYTCVAFTPKPQMSEVKASATIDITGVPDPPTNLTLSPNCGNRTTTISWEPGAANDAAITHFLIEQKATFPDFPDSAFEVIENVTDPNAKSYPLDLPGAATLYFRMRAVNSFGPSRASFQTTRLCRTDGAAPGKWPDNLRGIGKKPNTLYVTWTPMPRIEWNAPGLYYKLFYRKVSDGDKPMEDVEINDPTKGKFEVPDPGYHELWEFKIQAVNKEGPGKVSPNVSAYSGQDPPAGRPEDVSVGRVTARSVELSWRPVTVTRGSVDGYKIYYWGQSLLLSAKRRRRAIPSDAIVVDVSGGRTGRYTVTNLSPYTNFNMVIKAYNNGGEGPASSEVSAETDESEPGPPSDVNVYAFAKFILVTWESPVEPNGIIIDYQVGSKDYADGSEPKDVVVDMEQTGLDVRRKLLENQKPDSNYIVKIQAQTSKGWGTSARELLRTVKWSAPAKPNSPTVEGIDVDRVRVNYKFGVGGGYTHEFLVMYRKKVEGETFKNTSWVNHFETQSVEIGNLSPELYEFKTVARNDYPDRDNPEQSPSSDVTDGRPLPGIVNAGKRATTPVHKTAWFITLMGIVVLVLIGLCIMILYNRQKGTKYPVGKREKDRAALIVTEPPDQLDAPNDVRTEHPPPYKSDSSLHRDSDRDSLDDYGEGKFNEDGSFIQEYGDERTEPQGDKDQSALSTFV
ncbi:fibronectin type III domain-containing protein-like [Montipora capricornis]|uniref:fibronectin type III domain-containing protein-like n=1 Tax=Montipora capricornis TaxID=246305 RepID=UPI0035F17244